MNRLAATTSRCLRAGAVLAAALLAGCAGTPVRPTTDDLDEGTGTTVTHVAAPLVLASEDPAFAANARDYLYVAPLVVSQSGRRSLWLWLGLWSTIDRGVSVGATAPEDVAGLVLVADGEPIELDAAARVTAIPGVRSLPYAAPVATARNFFLPMTSSQLARFGAAREVAARTDMSDGSARDWAPWPAAAAAASLDGFTGLAATGR